MTTIRTINNQSHAALSEDLSRFLASLIMWLRRW